MTPTNNFEDHAMSNLNHKLAEALRYYEQALLTAFPYGACGQVYESWNRARKALIANESAAEPARLTDEQRIDWLCKEAVYHCGQWQVVFDSDKDSFIDAIDEMAAIAHGIDASEAKDKP